MLSSIALLVTILPLGIWGLPFAPEQHKFFAKEVDPPKLTPSLDLDFPDPAIIKVRDLWYSFATSSNGVHIQMASSKDFKKWEIIRKDALPQLPPWVDTERPSVWAPDVIQNDGGTFVMYFSATLRAHSAAHCIGLATSISITGPFTPLDRPYICPDPTGTNSLTTINPIIASPGRGGAIDASGFRDPSTGTRYVLWKVDGNSLTPSGTCGNAGQTKVPTPLMLARLGADGITPHSSAPVVLLDRTDNDGPLIEAPSLTRLPDGRYALFFSSNCWNSANYDVAWATSHSISGPFVRQDAVMRTGTGGLMAPGGASVASDGTHVVFHANRGKGRAMYATTLDASLGGGSRLGLRMNLVDGV
ncbi:Arabinanase/levansucrase/invertase [Microthyrium microscopicum]|uniref:Endo-1,5-alpha-L-arabinanase A n=1 Tax=Microthyrium microscopicum TaxID=703497 RepID=A0A6A6TW56_9PEZI|nr:Arabinanase/levansucrase/invertase [Microthyrium microscopicum]